MNDDDPPVMPWSHLSVLDLPGDRELVALVWPTLEEVLGLGRSDERRRNVRNLVAVELRRRVRAREIEASEAGLLRGLADALANPEHAELHAALKEALGAQLGVGHGEARRDEAFYAFKELVSTKTPGTFNETQRAFLDRVGRLFLDTLTDADIDDSARGHLRGVAEYDTDAALALLERDLAFIMHPLVAFRLCTWRAAYRAALEEPDTPQWSKAVDPTFADRREKNVERARRFAKLIADPSLGRNRRVDREGFRHTYVLVTNSLRAVETMWQRLQAMGADRGVKDDFVDLASAMTGLSKAAIKSLVERRDAFSAARRVELVAQYPTCNVSTEAVRKWIDEFITRDPDGDPTS